MAPPGIVESAARLLGAAAAPQSKIILFGSRARDDAEACSDFDFAVIEPLVASKAEEMVRLRKALDPLRIAADVVVFSREYVEMWGDVPGTMLYDALTEGRLIGET